MGTFLSLGVPDIMRRAYDMRELQPHGYRMGANVAIFAAMATEAFINDMTLVLQKSPWVQGIPELVAASNLMPELSKGKVSLSVKYELLYYVLAHQPLPKGELIWNNFILLTKIRNAIVHYKSSEVDMEMLHAGGEYTGIQRTIVSELKNKKLIRDVTPYEWTVLLDESMPFSDWAIKSAQEIILLIYAKLPESGIKIWFSSMTRENSSFMGGNRGSLGLLYTGN